MCAVVRVLLRHYRSPSFPVDWLMVPYLPTYLPTQYYIYMTRLRTITIVIIIIIIIIMFMEKKRTSSMHT
jgi:hypothetical protein